MKRILPTLWLLAVTACTPEVPANPSFQQDVLPILAANCVRCHSSPAIGGAPEVVIPQTGARFPAHRLDTYGDVTVREALLPQTDPLCLPPGPSDERCFPIIVAGAATMAGNAALRSGDEERPMPPRFRLDDHQVEILEAWAGDEAARGEPRPDNGQPEATRASIERIGSILRIQVRVDDPDRDVVGGSLYVRIAAAETFVGLVQSGVATVSWDATGITPGSYPLTARLDDGAAEILVDLGTITVGGP